MSEAEPPRRTPRTGRGLRAVPPPAQRPVFYLLAGPNGAGKSTLYKALAANGTVAPDIEFVNADLHPRTMALLAQAVRRVPLALLYDSEVVEAGTHRLVAVCRDGVAQPQAGLVPTWAADLLRTPG